MLPLVSYSCCSGDEDTPGGVDCVFNLQHSQPRCPCLLLRHVTAKPRLQTGLSDLHCAEHPPVSVLRQLRRQLPAVQRVRADVPACNDALLSTLRSTSDDDRRQRQEPRKPAAQKLPTYPTTKRMRQSTSSAHLAKQPFLFCSAYSHADFFNQ